MKNTFTVRINPAHGSCRISAMWCAVQLAGNVEKIF